MVVRCIRLALVFALALPCRAAVHYVNASAPPGGNGSSWATAFTTIQQGVNAGGEVWVAAGVYAPVRIENAVVYGGFGGTETARSQRNPSTHLTIIDGGGAQSAVIIAEGATQSTVLDGFILRNGAGTQVLNWPPPANDGESHGGGIYCLNASPTITHNRLENNVLHPMYMVQRDFYTWGTVYPGAGGGIYVKNGSPLIAFNTFTGNSAGISGGSAIYADGGSPVVSNNVFDGNRGEDLGTVTMYAGTLENNTIVGNGSTADDFGVAVRCIPGVRVQNNIIAFNTRGVSLAGAAIGHNDVFGNRITDYMGTDLTGTDGNIKADPLFAARASGDYHLAAGSPCIDAGISSVIPPGSLDFDGLPRIMGAGVDMGTFEFPGPIPYNVGDAAVALRVSAGIWGLNGAGFQRLNVDAATEGRLDVRDAVTIMRWVSGLEPNP